MLAIIGGTGLYDLPGLDIEARIDASVTPFGPASGTVLRGRVGNEVVLFLARHGSGHRLLPHEVNYRANVYALKRAGATQVLGVSAVGSLAGRIEPGHFAVPSQYFDWTRGRRSNTFFGDGVVAHVSTARPASRNMADWIADAAARLTLPLHRDVTYGCVEGPRFGTRAESLFLRQAGCQLVGMTNVPEAFLAREAQMCYAAICIATDYDCWIDDPARQASLDAVLDLYRASLERLRTLLDALLAAGPPPEDSEIRDSLRLAVLTPDAALSDAQREWLGVLRR